MVIQKTNNPQHLEGRDKNKNNKIIIRTHTTQNHPQNREQKPRKHPQHPETSTTSKQIHKTHVNGISFH